MFGMEDPAKVIEQYRHYVQDGRLEISEIMAEELAAKLMATPKRDLRTQGWLVDALRDHARILEIRSKWKAALKSAKRLSPQRSRYAAMLSSSGEKEAAHAARGNAVEDLIQKGRVLLGLRKLSAAKSCFKQAHKLNRSNIEAVLRPVEAQEKLKGNLSKAGKDVQRLEKTLSSAGPLCRQGEVFMLQPPDAPAHPLDLLLADIERWSRPALKLPAAATTILLGLATEYRRQMAAIESGQQAADAALAAAVDKLQPALDYHSYSGN